MRLHILPFAVGSHEIHVQQRGAAVGVELSSRDAIERQVGGFGIGVSGGSDAEEYVLQTHLAVDEIDERGYAPIQSGVGILHFHSALLGTLMVVVAGVVGQC